MNTIRLNILGEAKAASSGVSIKNQDKSVEITENGVTELTADSGYTGLGKVTINANVQGGGGESGGVKEYYCRISNETSYELREMLRAVLNMVVVSSVLDCRTIDGFNYCYKLTNGMNRDGSGAPLSNFYANIVAFSYLDSDTHIISYGMDKPTRLTGDLFDKLSQYAGGEEAEAIRQMLEPYFQEITKEEYESMITYKPE